jgi:hypothetical protein
MASGQLDRERERRGVDGFGSYNCTISGERPGDVAAWLCAFSHSVVRGLIAGFIGFAVISRVFFRCC